MKLNVILTDSHTVNRAYQHQRLLSGYTAESSPIQIRSPDNIDDVGIDSGEPFQEKMIE